MYCRCIEHADAAGLFSLCIAHWLQGRINRCVLSILRSWLPRLGSLARALLVISMHRDVCILKKSC